MKTPGIYIAAIATYCVFALVFGTAGAAAMTQQGSGNNLRDTAGLFGPEKMIERLEQQGVDVTEVKTALQNGDTNAVKEWLQACREAHPDAFPARGEGAGKGPMNGDAKDERITGMLENLTAQGYDISAISSAVTSGDFKTAHILMQEFRTAHPDLFPARGEGAGSGHPGGQMGQRRVQR
jgi:hypothetical protein